MAFTSAQPGKKRKPRFRHESAADRGHRSLSEHSKVDLRPGEDPARRARLERNDVKWLQWYCPNTFYLPMEKPHLEIIAGTRHAHKTGGRFAVAAERGIGKSAILYGMVAKYALSGEQPFPVYIPWGEKDKSQGFDFWLDCLANNDRIASDYPEICAPFRHARGVSQRVANTTWRHTGEPTHARIQASKGIIKFPDGRGYIGSSTMNGNPRGLNATNPGGKMVRPTMALIDDVQDDKVAASQGARGLCEKTIGKINGAIAGLKKAGAVFPILMSGNCIACGDVMAHYLSNSGWASVRVSCISKWPDEWNEPTSNVRQLWQEFSEHCQEPDGGEAYYKTHAKALTLGMVLTAPKTYLEAVREAVADKRRSITMPVDAFHAVIQEYYRMGHDAFMAERQQDPVDHIALAELYTITPEIVMKRLAKPKRKAFDLPDWVSSIVASTDINPTYALSTVLLGFGQDQTCAVLWYGLHSCSIPYDLPAPELAKRLFAELYKHGRELAAMPLRGFEWALDAGGANFDPVIRFAGESARLCGIPAKAYTGRSYDYYREYGKTYLQNQPRREECHIRTDIKNGRHIRWVNWQADYWKEIAQRAFLGAVGAPGAVTLYEGSHNDFARQMCASKLIAKGDFGGKLAWKWNETPGRRDFFDAMGQGYAAAAFGGIGTGGTVKRKRYKETRKCKVQREDLQCQN